MTVTIVKTAPVQTLLDRASGLVQRGARVPHPAATSPLASTPYR